MINERMTPQQLEIHEAGGSHETDVLCAEIRASWADHAAAIERIEREIRAFAGLETMYNAASMISATTGNQLKLAQEQLQNLSQPSEGEPHARMWHAEAFRLAQKYGEETFYHSPVCINKGGHKPDADQKINRTIAHLVIARILEKLFEDDQMDSQIPIQFENRQSKQIAQEIEAIMNLHVQASRGIKPERLFVQTG